VSPSYIHDVAAATRHLLQKNVTSGLYHIVNSGQGTWHDVALEAARVLGVTPRLVPVTMDQVAMRALRPRFCALSPRKLAEAGFVMPPWPDALQRWLAARDVTAA
jgi:dTDP-4-dehydrorhamnose reductase